MKITLSVPEVKEAIRQYLNKTLSDLPIDRVALMRKSKRAEDIGGAVVYTDHSPEEIRCPHCHEKEVVPDQLLVDTRSYQAGTYNAFCTSCKKPIMVQIKQPIIVNRITIGTHTQGYH